MKKIGLAMVVAVVASMGRAQETTIRGLDAAGRLTFVEIAGASGYQVERASKVDGIWSGVGPVVGPSGSGTVTATLATAASAAEFYRVVSAIRGGVFGGMAYIPAGTSQMGDGYAEGNADERPVHDVTLSAFYMDTHEVTKAAWDAVRVWAVANGYVMNVGEGKAPTHPVQTVNWFDCVKWCNARSEMDGLAPCYTVGGAVYRTGEVAPDCNWTAVGYRLPTDAEWEKAARGGVAGMRFPWSDIDFIDHTRANYTSTWVGGAPSYAYDKAMVEGRPPAYKLAILGNPFTGPVGSFASNGYGLYDMAGNVEEVCWDWYSATYYTTSPPTDPRGPASGSFRVKRGGNWSDLNGANRCRVAFRVANSAGAKGSNLGFRTVRIPGP